MFLDLHTPGGALCQARINVCGVVAELILEIGALLEVEGGEAGEEPVARLPAGAEG